VTSRKVGGIVAGLGNTIGTALLNVLLGDESHAEAPRQAASRGHAVLTGVVFRLTLPGPDRAPAIGHPVVGAPNEPAPESVAPPASAAQPVNDRVRETSSEPAPAGARDPWRSSYGGADYLDRMLDEDPGLATLDDVQRTIFEVEKVKVVFIHPSHEEVAPNKRAFVPYPYKRKIPNDTTVAAFVHQRLAPFYELHGLRGVVQNPDGSPVGDETTIRDVRDAFGY
jgi:hypothetical protein